MSSSTIVLIDMDSVLVDFEKRLADIWILRHPELPLVPFAERKSFYPFDDHPPYYKQLMNDIISEGGFFLGLEWIPGAQEALQELEKIADVFIYTSPMSNARHCACEKIEWVRRNLGDRWTERVILTRDKTLVHGDYLIDDKPEITGVRKPDCEQLVFEAPYNAYVRDRRHTN